MFLTFQLPKEKERDWLISLLQYGYELIEYQEHQGMIFLDEDLVNILDVVEPEATGQIDIKKATVVKGLCTKEEIKTIEENLQGNILLKGMQHVYYLDQTGFFGDPGICEHEPDEDNYWVEWILSDTLGAQVLKEMVLSKIPKIRLRELFE